MLEGASVREGRFSGHLVTRLITVLPPDRVTVRKERFLAHLAARLVITLDAGAVGGV